MAKYGQGGRVESASASGDNFAGSDSQVYTFATPVKKAWVQLRPGADADTLLYVICNGSAASPSAWEMILTPGDLWVSPDGVTVSTIAMYSNAALSLGTDYCVRGWE